LRYSLKKNAEIQATVVDWVEGRAVIRLQIGQAQQTVPLPVVGYAMARNAVAAVAVAFALGLSLEEIVRGLQRIRPLNLNGQGRMVVEQYRGIWVVNDTYNANPLSMQAALETLQQLPIAGRRFAILGDMLEFARAFTEIPYPGSKVCSPDECVDFLLDHLRPGDAVLFKGSRGMEMEKILEKWKQRIVVNR